MDLKLKKFVGNVMGIAALQASDTSNSIVVRLSNSFTAKITVVVCSHKEPVDLVLPINVTWIVTDPNSALYTQPLIRVNKVNVAGDSFVHHWKVATLYREVMVDQEYDNVDQGLLGDITSIGFATNKRLGLVALSCKPATTTVGEDIVDLPIAVGTLDYRLSDDRVPLPHTHEPIPVTEFATNDTNYTISIAKLNAGASDNLGKVLKIVSLLPLRAEWVKLTAADFAAL